MDGYSADTAFGRVQSGYTDTIFWPRTPRIGKRGVILLHGATASGEWTNGDAQGSVPLGPYLASNGVPCIAATDGGDLWGNSTAQTIITAAWGVLIAQCGVAADKMCLFGHSMGGGAAALYAMLNPTKVAAGYGVAPVSDLTEMYVNNRGATRASIATAWGVTYPAALPSGANLPAQASGAAGIPWRMDYSTADTVVIASTVTTLATAMGSACSTRQTSTSADHGNALFALTTPSDVLTFMLDNGA